MHDSRGRTGWHQVSEVSLLPVTASGREVIELRLHCGNPLELNVERVLDRQDCRFEFGDSINGWLVERAISVRGTPARRGG